MHLATVVVILLCCCSVVVLAGDKYFERGREEFHTQKDFERRNGKQLTVVYKQCHSGKAVKVRFPKKHRNRWHESYKVIGVTRFFKWGFKVHIKANRSAVYYGRMVLNWKAVFNSKRDYRSPCPNAKKCQNTKLRPICTCKYKYKGELCNDVKKFCYPNPCQNKGTCTELSNGYNCTCIGMYTGINCNNVLLNDTVHIGNVNVTELPVLINVTHNRCYSEIPLHVNATLMGPLEYTIDILNASRTGLVASINKKQGFFANRTIINVGVHWFGLFKSDRALATPCGSRGICINTHEQQSCQCNSEYQGKHCEEKSTRCESGPCQNGGTCEESKSNYTCDCPEGFGGKVCEFYAKRGSLLFTMRFTGRRLNKPFDECFNAAPEIMTGRLRKVMENETRSWSLEILEFREHFFRARMDLMEYLPGPSKVKLFLDWIALFRFPQSLDKVCYNNATCLNRRSSYICQCQPGFQGEFCDIANDSTSLSDVKVPQSAGKPCSFSPCHNGASCLDTEDGGYQCSCVDGYSGKHCLALEAEKSVKQEVRTGVYPVGSNPVFCRNTKKIDVVYDDCYAREASRVSAVVEGDPSWPDKFVVAVESIHIWGFKAIVRRVDYASGWGQDKLELKWNATFVGKDLEKVCSELEECHNSKKGQRCDHQTGD